MDSTVIISAFAGLIIISIMISAISYSRQQALAKRKKLFKKHQSQATEILSVVHMLANIDEKYDLLLLLQKQVVAELLSAVDLFPDESNMNSLLQSETARLAMFKEKKRDEEVRDYCTSDTELNQTRTQLGVANKIIDIFFNRHDISKAKKEELQTHIKHLTLNVEVNSNLHQANKYVEQNDVVMFQIYVKQAMKVLKKTSIEFDNKNARIKQLSDTLKESKSTNKAIAIE